MSQATNNKIFSNLWMIAVYLFLYLPIFTLVVYSFNDSKLISTWTHASLRWYEALIKDDDLISAVLLSLKIAGISALMSVFFGTFTAFALNRYKRFKGRTLLSSMSSMPLVMPDVIVGLSLLLMIISVQHWLGFPEKGLFTILLGHALLGTAYAAVVVTSRLREMDSKLDEAAMDLGCKPWQVFYLVTLPLLLPALISAFLLTFTLSFDDVVLSSFLSGPGYSTMPMVIFSRARLGLNPTINAVATVTIVVVTFAVIASSFYTSHQARKRKREEAQAYSDSNK
ncbi:MAG: ABC transporter permease subunit [Methylotenera sp.]|jgi:putrescine transport system permease protein|nr:ABC transporter permease subunit [Methylotenera sp.]HPH07473.1 ABC transporter permease subunit [Methylotenera sp.]HPM49768.1 ABC transporter permease subunit [Methylotenera sp.]HPV33244.1 ABC transporter permease subunit [Methylotenera sp.]HQM86486.1 ABC transporter permease subunit [Methylotenera sp.]